METGNDIKASLNISIQVHDTISFANILETCPVHLTLLVDPSGYNIFHDIATSLGKESYLLEFLQILIRSFYEKYSDYSESTIKEMINSLTVKDKFTPLLFAVKHNRKVRSIQNLVKEFIKLGADPRIKNINRHGPVHVAVAHGKIAMVVYLNSIGLSINEEDIHYRLPIHISALEGQEFMTLLLIAWSKDLEKKDEEGYTALHMAAISQSYRIARHLIINGAKRKAKDKSGKTPLDIALSKNNQELISLLVGYI